MSAEECDEDHLSYSYSCIQAFQHNQQIIGAHTSLTKAQNLKVLDKNPKIFTTSGDRNNPIYQPFYYKADYNQEETGVGVHTQNISCNVDCLVNTKNDLKQEVPKFCLEEQNNDDKNIIFKWINNQLKNINTLWPISLPLDGCISRFFKKSQQLLKMEMLLNNIDENTKEKIIRYMGTLNLNIEEKINLCNETIFEVDISPILADPIRLQNFLKFLQHTELINSRVNKNSKANGQYFENKKVTVNTNILEKDEQKHFNETSNKLLSKNCDDERVNSVYTIQNKNLLHNQLSSISLEMDKTNLDGRQRYKYESIEENDFANMPIGQPLMKDKFTLKHPEKQKVNTSTVNNSKTLIKDKSILTFMAEPKKNVGNKHCTTNCMTKKSVFNHKICNTTCKKDLNGYKEGDFSKRLINKNNSCKCLIHDNREDFYRYRHQCLFGNGDEISNSFIKYIATKENNDTLDDNCGHIELNNKRLADNDKTFSREIKSKLVTKGNIAKELNFVDLTGQSLHSCNMCKRKVSKDLHTDSNKKDLRCSSEKNDNRFSIKHINNLQSNCIQDSKFVNENNSNKQRFKVCFDDLHSDTDSSSSSRSIKQTENSLEMKSATTILNKKYPPTTKGSDEYCMKRETENPCERKLDIIGKQTIVDDYKKLQSNSNKQRCSNDYSSSNNSTQSLENITQIDTKIHSFLQDNVNLHSNDERKIDLVMKNAEELKAKAFYLNKFLEAFNEKKVNTFLNKDYIGDTFRNKKDELGELSKTTLSKTATAFNKSNNRSKHYFGPKTLYRRVSSVFKISKNKNYAEMHQVGDSKIRKFRFKSLENEDMNKFTSNEQPSHSLIEHNSNGHSTTGITEQTNKTWSCDSQDYIQDHNNLEKLSIEIKNQREAINSIKQLLVECLNKN